MREVLCLAQGDVGGGIGGKRPCCEGDAELGLGVPRQGWGLVVRGGIAGSAKPQLGSLMPGRG